MALKVADQADLAVVDQADLGDPMAVAGPAAVEGAGEALAVAAVPR